jgi:hypothetical protein
LPTPTRVKHLVYEVQMLDKTRHKLREHYFRDQWGRASSSPSASGLGCGAPTEADAVS